MLPRWADLRALALKATTPEERWGKGELSVSDHAYFSAAHPQAILALLAENERLRKALAPLANLNLREGDVMWFNDPVQCIGYDECKAAQEALRDGGGDA